MASLGSAIYAWSDAGYTRTQPRPLRGDVDILTPPSIVKVYSLGYRPAVHPGIDLAASGSR